MGAPLQNTWEKNDVAEYPFRLSTTPACLNGRPGLAEIPSRRLRVYAAVLEKQDPKFLVELKRLAVARPSAYKLRCR